MKLLQAMAGADYGGAEEFFVRLAIALNSSVVQQRVVIRKHKLRASQLRAGGVEPVELGFGSPLDVATRWRLRQQISEFKPDIVLTWMNRATAMLPARGKFLHVGRLGGYYNLKYYRACDHLVANTEDIANYLKNNGWGEDQVHYLPNFVTAKRVPKIERKELYTSNNATLLLALGRLHENKAFDVLLKAFAQVPNAYLWIAGEGPLRETLEREAERLGVRARTRFLGWRQDVAALYATADILVCPSRHEPLGNVIIEGWAHGVPVVAADNLGPGALIKDGETGLLFPVNDANALAAALKRLISNDELGRRLAENGKKIYKKKFSEKIVVDKYIKLFEQMSL